MFIMKIKFCYNCKQEKPLNEFYLNKAKSDGYSTECKACNKFRTKLYQIKNKEKVKKYKSNYYNANKLKIKEEHKKYYQDNKENLDKINKEWAKNNKKRSNSIKKQYVKNNPEQRKQSIILCSRKRRAKKKELNENYTHLDEQYTRNLFNNKCVNCGSTEVLHIDHHYPLSKGYVLTRKNAVILCNSCNSSKGNKLPEDFYDKKTLSKITKLLSK